MNAMLRRIHAAALASLAIAGLSVAFQQGSTFAQQNPYCSTNHPGEGATVDATLGLESRLAVEVRTVRDEPAFGERQVDEVQLTWEASALSGQGASCIWIRRVESGTPGLADFIVPAEQGSFSIRPHRLSGSGPERACYVLIAMSDRAMGEELEVCVTVENPRAGIPPGAGGTPGAPSAGTGLISDEGSGAWLVGFAVVTGTIVLVLVTSGVLRRRRGG